MQHPLQNHIQINVYTPSTDLSCLMASVFFSFSSQVSLSSAISFSDIYNQDKKKTLLKALSSKATEQAIEKKKCDFVNIRKNKMKKAPLSKSSLIVQIGG